MEVVSLSEMTRREEKAFASGLTADALMEVVGEQMAMRLGQIYPQVREFLVLVGQGNNGGDGLVVARQLIEKGFMVRVVLAESEENLKELPRKKLAILRKSSAKLEAWRENTLFPDSHGVVLDALLGLQARGPLREKIRDIVRSLNQARSKYFFRTVALDLPSGLAAYESGPAPTEQDAAVIADVTLAVGFAKTVLCREAMAGWVGRLEVLPWSNQRSEVTQVETLAREELAGYLPRRNALSFKNDFGRLVIIAGSTGFSGAAVLCAQAGLAMGAGLVSVITRQEIWPIVATQCPPEVMVSAWPSPEVLNKASAIIIGPGLGEGSETREMLRAVLEVGCPVVIDADGLNSLAGNLALLEKKKAPVLLTPHPGEMARLIGRKFTPDEREEVVRHFVKSNDVVLVLKGTRTLVTANGEALYYNTSGNPGLSAGGSGDTLAGLLGALLAQKVSPWAAARLGVWLHGHAADLFLLERGCEEGMTATGLSHYLSKALVSLRSNALSINGLCELAREKMEKSP